MHTSVRLGSNDEGETLIELIIAVAIASILVVAVIGGIATSILMSDIHRKQATAGAYVRNYAEAVVAYVADGNFDPGASPDYKDSRVGLKGLPGGFVASVTSVRCWDSNRFSGCPTASAVQQVTLNIASKDLRASEALTVIVRKP